MQVMQISLYDSRLKSHGYQLLYKSAELNYFTH